jgi:hypothetical protein
MKPAWSSMVPECIGLTRKKGSDKVRGRETLLRKGRTLIFGEVLMTQMEWVGFQRNVTT